MLLMFAATAIAGMGLLYFASRYMLLSSFQQLENQQMKQDVQNALDALDEQYRTLGNVTDDYAYWDKTYDFLGDPAHHEIKSEFKDLSMEGVELNLVVLRDMQGRNVFAKAYDTQRHHEVALPEDFLRAVFAKREMAPESEARLPQDGLLAFPDGAYLVSTRPVLTSQRTGRPRGILLLARKFDETGAFHITNLTRTSVKFEREDSASLPEDYGRARLALRQDGQAVNIQALSEEMAAGYAMVRDLFGEPLLILRVDTQRPIHDRGKLSQLYLFGAVSGGAVLCSVAVIFWLQKFVLARLDGLRREVSGIGDRKAIAERVRVRGRDELSDLGNSINEMLEELEKSQRQFLLITEHIQQIFWIREAQTGRYAYISAAYERVFGRTRASLLENPESWKESLYAEDGSVVARMQGEQAKCQATEGHYRIVGQDGTPRWLWERTFPLFDGAGNLQQICGLTEDITEFKRNEDALMRAQTKLEQRVAERTAELAERGELVKLLVDSTPGAMYGLDAEGICTFCNPAGVRLFGYSDAAELLGRPVHQMMHHTRADGSPYPAEECPILHGSEEGQATQALEDIFWRKDGSSFPVEFSSRQIRRDGKLVGAVVTFLDITERRRQEMEIRHGQKLEAVGRLAAGIAHEINTPIQFVGDNTRFLLNSFQDELKLIRKYEQLQERAAGDPGNASLLAEISATRTEIEWPYLEEEIPRALGQMLEGLGRVSTIVRGMKEFSHVNRSSEKSSADINRALESTLIVARNELKYVADVETHFGELPAVVCHLGDLNQVFLNLLVNAAHAIEEASKGSGAKGKIGVQTRRDGDWVEVAIADSGAGIPEEARDKIFEPFFTTKAVGKGTGQGLALARAVVVEKHGGTLTFVSERGKGTTFFVRLPLLGVTVREEALVL
jgi:PAS domain S-box-containing protein